MERTKKKGRLSLFFSCLSWLRLVVWSLSSGPSSAWSSGFSRLLSLVRSLSSGLSSLSRLSFVDSRLVTHLIRSLVFSDLSSSLVFLSSLLSHLHSPLTCWQRNLPVHFLAMLRFHRCVRPSVLLLSVCLHVHNTYNSPLFWALAPLLNKGH